MKKALLIIAVVAVLGAVGFAGYNLAKPEKGTSTNTETNGAELIDPEQADKEDISNIELTAADKEHLSGANAGKTVDATDQTEVTLTMRDFKFDTTYLRIKSGTTVTWINDGDNGHDVTPAEGSPNQFEGSELLQNGESYEITFDEVGKYYYMCSPHDSEMRAIVEVVQ